jgi:hypothetical protein
VIGITGGKQRSFIIIDGNLTKADHIPEKVDVNPPVHADVNTKGNIGISEIGDPEFFNLVEFHSYPYKFFST